MLLSMASLYLLGHNYQNQVKHDSVHVMLLAPVMVAHGAIGIENDITSFLRSRQSK